MVLAAAAFAVPKTKKNVFTCAMNNTICNRAKLRYDGLEKAKKYCAEYHYKTCPKITVEDGLSVRKDGHTDVTAHTAVAFDRGVVGDHELWYVDEVKLYSLSGTTAILTDKKGAMFGAYMSAEMYSKVKKLYGEYFDCYVFQDGSLPVILDVYRTGVEEYMLIDNFFSQEDFDETVALTNELLGLYKIPSYNDYEK